jgi:hypothetical protein
MRHDKGSAMVFTIILLAIILIVGLASFSLFHHLYRENLDRQEDFQAHVEREKTARDVYTELITFQPESPATKTSANIIPHLEATYPDVEVTYDDLTDVYTISFDGFVFTVDEDFDNDTVPYYTITSWQHTA